MAVRRLRTPELTVGRGGRRVVLALVVVALAGPASAQGSRGNDLVARGKYILGAAAGCGCHSEPGKAEPGKTLNAGGRKYDGPFGTVYSSNITPDAQTGIGNWTDEQIITAIRSGRRPNSERLVPVHPYPVFNGMAEIDLRALVAYLRSVPPVNRPNTPKKITMPLFESVFLPTWLAAFATVESPIPVPPTSGVARGEYLVRAVGHCGECHTPRGMTNATDNSRFLSGTQRGPDGDPVPNITPEKQTGLTWTEDEIADYLETGNKPDGDVAGGLMAEVIQGSSAGYKDLTKEDRLAIAKYLKTVPPIKNKVSK